MKDGTPNLFALKRHVDSSVGPVTAVEINISLSGLLKIPVGQRFLFKPLNPSGEVIQVPFESAATQARLSMYASQITAFASRSVALHGLQSGCAISLAIAGTKLDAIMDHVGWKSPSTA